MTFPPPSSFRKTTAAMFAAALLAPLAPAAVAPNSLFSDNAVLQRDVALPVWGTAADGEQVTVEFDGRTASTVAKNGQWQVRLKAHGAGGPYTLRIAGADNSVTLTNVLVGDVWLASGQSNMQYLLGANWWATHMTNGEAEKAAASHAQIRQFRVPTVPSFNPIADVKGNWSLFSQPTAPDYSAVAYYFARDLQPAVKVPIGILFSAWGGTIAEAWTSAEALKKMSDFTNALEAIHDTSPEQFAKKLAAFYAQNDPGSAAQPAWSAAALDDRQWATMTLPTYWQRAGLPDFNGIVWFRKEITVPAAAAGQAAILHLDSVDDQDTAWVNGVPVGASHSHMVTRHYPVPAGVLQAGKNVIAVRVLDTGGLGGLCGKADKMNLEILSAAPIPPISLAGEWRYRATTALAKLPPVPANPAGNPNVVTVLYHGMIEPLQPFPFKGVIWYQGESNDDGDGVTRPRQYRTLFPLLIADWRRHWGLGDFPFLFVQIAPYKLMTPEIREAQLLTLKKAPNTAMAVITDAGDANNIHPTDKQTVGARLAVAARALAYGEKIESSGPLYQGVKFKDGQGILRFTHLGGGLVAKGGDLTGFTLCGADKKFVPAHAVIRGQTVVVSSDQVAQPVAVRYGWSNVPDVNLYNQAGLPASPFRTDVD